MIIIKGKARGDGGQLASYLLTEAKNEKVSLAETRGLAGSTLQAGLRIAETEAELSRGKKPLWHAQINPANGVTLTPEQQLMAVEILERHLGFEGLPRAIVVHHKDGQNHVHVTWSRFDRDTSKLRRTSFSHRKNVAAAAEIAQRLGLQPNRNPFDEDLLGLDRRQRRERSKKRDRHAEQQHDERAVKPRQERKAEITALWKAADSGKAFRAALETAGYILAQGRRGFVVVDANGETHSLARQIEGAQAKDVRARLADIDLASLPLADEIAKAMRRTVRERRLADGLRPELAPTSPAPAQDRAKVLRFAPEQDRARTLRFTSKTASPQDNTEANPHPGEQKRSQHDRQPDTKEPPPRVVDAESLLAALTHNHSTFTRQDAARLADERLGRDRLDPEKQETFLRFRASFDALMAEFDSLPDLIRLGADSRGRERFTSRTMLETELRMEAAGANLAGRDGHGVEERIREAVPGIQGLGADQRSAYDHVTGAGDLALVVGFAGTGKSRTLGLAREAWEAGGMRVRGAALSGIAAENLGKEAGIASRTLHSLLHQLETLPEREKALAAAQADLAAVPDGNRHGRQRSYLTEKTSRMARDLDAARLGKRDVIVIDEAAMVGSRQMEQLLSKAADAGAKVVLVGDHEQLQAVEAGAAFRALQQRHGAQEITEVRRQKQDWMRDATREFGRTQTPEALDRYRKADLTHEAETGDRARADLVKAWTASRAAVPDQTQIILAYTRADVAELNDLARASYRAEGRLGEDKALTTATGTKTFADGDRLYFTKNDTRLAVRNGTLGTIERIKGNTASVKLDAGRTVTFDLKDYGHITHGYAATIHKSQGVTVDRAHVLASSFMDRHATYVGMTRHRERADLYYAAAEFKDFESMVRRVSRNGAKDTTLDYVARASEEGRVSDDLRNAARSFWKRERPSQPPPAWTRADKDELRPDAPGPADRGSVLVALMRVAKAQRPAGSPDQDSNRQAPQRHWPSHPGMPSTAEDASRSSTAEELRRKLGLKPGLRGPRL